MCGWIFKEFGGLGEGMLGVGVWLESFPLEAYILWGAVGSPPMLSVSLVGFSSVSVTLGSICVRE